MEKNKSINHIFKIMSKRHNILMTRTSFFILSAGENCKLAGIQNETFRVAIPLQMTVM